MQAAKHDEAVTPSYQESATPELENKDRRLSIKEDLARHWRVYVLGLCTSFGGLLFGWDTGLIGGVLEMQAFQNSFGLIGKGTELAALKGNIVAVLQSGCFFGAASGLYLPHRFGRMPTMILAALIFLIGSTIQTTCRLNGQSAALALKQLYVGRAIGGFGVGLSSAVVPVYLSECAPRAVRGRLAGMYQLLNVTGICLSFFVNYGLVQSGRDPMSQSMWQIPFALQALPGTLFITTIVFQPESPRWLVERGRSADAAKSLAKIYRLPIDHPTVTGIVAEIEEDLEGKEKLSLKKQLKLSCSDRVTFYRVISGAILMFFQQFSGTNSLNTFAPQIFRSLGLQGSSAGLLATGVYGVVKITFTALFLFVAIEQLGRKWCLISGGAIQVFTLFWIAIYQAVRPSGTPVDGVGYLTIAMVYIFVIGYSLGWSSVPWAVSAEVAPNQLRAVAMALATMSQWFFNFVIVKITPLALQNIKYGTFLIFGIITTFGVIWAALALPETSGLTLELVGKTYEGNIIMRSIQDLSPKKRRVYRARLLAENGGTADGATARLPASQQQGLATLDRTSTLTQDEKDRKSVDQVRTDSRDARDEDKN